jgi:hypothetical protein
VKSSDAMVQAGGTLAEVVPASTVLDLTGKVSPIVAEDAAVGQRAQVRVPARASPALRITAG